jgi:hypothetical protein
MFQPRFSRQDLVGAIRRTLEFNLKRVGRLKSDLAREVFLTRHQALVSRRLYGKSEWKLDELADTACFLGMTLVEFMAEVEIDLIGGFGRGLDNEANMVVG